ncbi:hypothetical protein MMC25_006550 [Agyrium rufum]|nr:hypothetical protein [Agyrium rufum]
MSEFFRDTVFGHLVRLVTRGKVLSYVEDRDPETWKRYVNHEASRRIAHHGHTGEHEPKDGEEEEAPNQNEDRPQNTSHESSRTRIGDNDVPAVKTQSSTPRNIMGHRIDPEKGGRDVTMVDWYGDDDPENPMNWSTAKKFVVTFFICLLTFSIYIGSAIYTPGIETITQQFGVSQVKATLGLTLFVAGYGIGPMLWAPMSEIPQIGRNPVYIGTLIVFVVFQVPIALAPNFATVLVFRFLTGFFGSPVLATGGASIGDMFTPQKRAYAIAIWGVAAVSGPTMGPLIGGFAAEAKGWTWTIWELMWLSGFSLIFFIFVLPETSAANILYRRTRRLRILTKNDNLRCEPELVGETMTPREIVMIALVRPFSLTFTEPIVFALNLYIALIYGLLYIWFESFPIVFVELYGFSLGLEGLSFVGILLGSLVTIPPFFWYLHKYTEPKIDQNGNIKPEHRLPAACVGAFCIPICLFWFGWSARPSIHWIMPIIGSAWFSVGALLLFNSVLNYLGDAYPEYAASVLAGNDLIRSSFGAGFPLFASAMYKKLGVGWASSLLGFLSILFIPIPFILVKYGERLRHASKRARHDI